MEVTRLAAAPFGDTHDLIIVPATVEGDMLPGVPEEVLAALAAAQERGSFRGKPGDELSISLESGLVLVLGVGSNEDLTVEGFRAFGGRAVRAAERLRQASITICGPTGAPPGTDEAPARVRAIAEGALLAGWRFRELKTEEEDDATPPVQAVSLWVAEGSNDEEVDRGIMLGVAAARGENLARTLQQFPGNLMTPTILADRARSMAESVGIECEVWGPEKLENEQMHALLSVSHGTDEEPRFIVLRYDGGQAGEAPVALVGKGLTFDAGGISLKPAKGMEEMKYDMSGGAAVIGAVQAIAEAALPINVLGVVPSSENLMNGKATKPGDVISSRAGKSIEVINTDAEGRLILADALAWTAEQKPQAVVDCATLTGAVIIALGHRATAVMTPDDELSDELVAAGERTGERCWRLPLWDAYRKQLDSDVADLKNVGGRPGGTITAGCFLKEFAGEVPWAHLDIAGTAWGQEPEPYQLKGPTGVPTRLLFEWVRGRSE